MCYLIKRLGHQEMGSIGEDGRPQRGRYILISKAPQALGLFPPLSDAIRNHGVVIPIVPLYNSTPQRIYCNFIYHNDKHVDSNPRGRDEYRIYLNNTLENNSLLFHEGDIVILKQDINDLTNPQIDGNGNEDDNDNTLPNIHALFLYHCSDHESELYQQCSRILDTNPLPRSRGNQAFYQEPLALVEEQIHNLTNTAHGHYAPAVDNTVVNRITNPTTGTDLASLFTSVSFRDFVMTGYNFSCAITHNVIRYQDIFNLETAHIRARSHGGTYMPNNGIALCRDMHWAFDRGMFTIDDDYRIRVHPEMQNGYLGQFNNQQIFLPENEFFRPALENLRYHREHLYGLFIHSASLTNAPGYQGNR